LRSKWIQHLTCHYVVLILRYAVDAAKLLIG
jgi:hypothetical protein